MESETAGGEEERVYKTHCIAPISSLKVDKRSWLFSENRVIEAEWRGTSLSVLKSQESLGTRRCPPQALSTRLGLQQEWSKEETVENFPKDLLVTYDRCPFILILVSNFSTPIFGPL